MKMFMNGCKAYSAENLSESAKLAEIQRENNSAGMCKGIIFANKKEKKSASIFRHLPVLLIRRPSRQVPLTIYLLFVTFPNSRNRFYFK